jgi:hypothetical protein
MSLAKVDILVHLGGKTFRQFQVLAQGIVVGRHFLPPVNLSGSLLLLSIVMGRCGEVFGHGEVTETQLRFLVIGWF